MSVLAILVRNENYCQAVTKELIARTGKVHFETSVNRALLRMTRDGLLVSRWEIPDDDVPGHQGPPRRYFSLTGKAVEAVSQPVPIHGGNRSIA